VLVEQPETAIKRVGHNISVPANTLHVDDGVFGIRIVSVYGDTVWIQTSADGKPMQDFFMGQRRELHGVRLPLKTLYDMLNTLIDAELARAQKVMDEFQAGKKERKAKRAVEKEGEPVVVTKHTYF
jgi:hypothetical protein